MVVKTFLTHEKNSLRIAKLAILFQTTITSIIVTILITILLIPNDTYTFPYLFLIALNLDTAFVFFHVLYRALYRGPKIKLPPFLKKILLGHVLASLLALILSYVLVYGYLELQKAYLYLTLISWFVSLILGIIFFIEKYLKK